MHTRSTTNVKGHSFMNCLYIFLLVASISIPGIVSAQPWTYNFGTGTGDWLSGSSTVFLPPPPGGTARVSVGGGGAGSFHLDNEGLVGFGTDTELRGQASKNGNSDKFSMYNFTPSKAYFMHFLFRLDNAEDGSWFFCAGDGNSFENDASSSGSQVFTNIQWKFEEDNAISTKYRNGPSFVNLPAGTFNQGVNYSLDIYMNNSSAVIYYQVGALIYTVGAYKWDMWINGILVSNDLAGGQLANNTNIDSWMFYSSKSTDNLATIYLDDFTIIPLLVDLLPVTIQTFSLETSSGHVDVNWTTASELNTSYFEVEKSANPFNFERIGVIPAAGVSTEEISYSYPDNDPYSGTSYYRLKTIYTNGTFEYSNIVSTNNDQVNNDVIHIYPSPVANLIQIQPYNNLPQEYSVSIYDMAGSKIMELPYSSAGFDVSALHSGMYLLMIEEGDFRSVEMFVKQ